MKTKFYAKLKILLSIVAVFTCLTLATSTTFAFFTQNKSAQNNFIYTGSLDVDVLHLDDGGWVSIKDNPNHVVFENQNFEPGVFETQTLKIQNDGSLAISYQLLSSVKYNTPVKGPYGENLADVIDVYYCRGIGEVHSSSDLEDSSKWTNLGTFKQLMLKQCVVSGKVLPQGVSHSSLFSDPNVSVGDSTITLAIKMREGVSKNYVGLDMGNVTLTLVATQHTYEYDSFDNLYDRVPYTGLLFNDGLTHNVSETVIFDHTTKYTDIITATGVGTVVNISGGYYDVASRDCAVWATDGAVVNIYGGTFIGDGLGAPADANNHQDLIYAGANGGAINIYDGNFISRSEGAWLLNERDHQGTITVYGGTFTNWNPKDNTSEGENTNFCADSTVMFTEQVGEDTVYTVKPYVELLPREDNVYKLEGDVAVLEEPFFFGVNEKENYTVDGGNNTVELVINDYSTKSWDVTEYIPPMSTVFTTNSTSENLTVTVKDITFTGEAGAIWLNDYRPDSVASGNRSKRTAYAYNLNVSNLKIFRYSNYSGRTVGGALVCACTSYLYNCSGFGTTLSPQETATATETYDLCFVNSCKSYVYDSSFGTAITWGGSRVDLYNTDIGFLRSQAKKYGTSSGLYIYDGCHIGTLQLFTHELSTSKSVIPHADIKAGAVIDVLDLTYIVKTPTGNPPITIDAGATIGKIIDSGVEYSSYEDWLTNCWATKTN